MQKNLAQSAATTTPTQEDISRRATQLWENYGHPQERDLDIWLEAERQLLGVDRSVEGRNNTSVGARGFDESTTGKNPRSRLEKTVPTSTSARSRR